MSRASRERAALVGVTVIVIVSVLAFALLGARVVGGAVAPRLSAIVVVVGTITGVWQLVAGIVSAVARNRFGVETSVPLLLGASALAMVVAFLPSSPHSAPRLLPLLSSAFFAALAALTSRFAHARSHH